MLAYDLGVELRFETEAQPVEWPTTTGTPDPTRNESAASAAFARKNGGF